MDETLLTNLRRAYQKTAVERDTAVRQDWKLAERANFLHCLQANNKKSLLEIGAGPGRDSLFFQENGMEVIATDLSPEMARLCQDKGLTAYEMDFDHLTFSSQFDAIYALNCLLHVPKANLPAILQRLRGLLKGQGLFFIGVYGGEDWEGIFENDHHKPKRFFSLYTNEHIQEVVGHFFNLIYFKEIPMSNGVRNFQSMIWQKEAE